MNTDKTLRKKILALAMGVALLGTVFGAVLATGINDVPTASAENLTALAAQASTASDLDSPFKAVYEEVSPSIVGVQLTTQRRISNGRITSDSSFVGSGVVIAEGGYVVTNYHVVTGGSTEANASVAENISVIYNEEEYAATYIAGDASTDIAILQAKELDAPAVKLGNSDELSVGDWALVVGNPLGEDLTNTLTVGVISGLNRATSTKATDTAMIQTDAAINSGNSGGGLFNIRGELIGITSMKMSGGGMFGIASIESIGFAIPVNTVTRIADDLIQYGQVVYPRMGIQIDTVSTGFDEPSKEAFPNSVWVVDVEEGSPAEQAGLQVDDLIVEADGERVRSTDELQSIVRKHTAGESVELKVYRIPGAGSIKINEDIPDGEYVELTVGLEMLDVTEETQKQ